MSKDLHNEDEYFRKAYRQTEEEPSPAVWEKISMGLDNANAVYYRNKFTTWKRIAYILFLISGGAVFYQIFFTGQTVVTSRAVVQHKNLITDSNTTGFKQNIKDSHTGLQQVEKSAPENGSFNNSLADKKFINTQKPEQTLMPVNHNKFIEQSSTPANQTGVVTDASLITIEKHTKDFDGIAFNTNRLNNMHPLNTDYAHELLMFSNKKNVDDLASKISSSKSKKRKGFKPYFTITPYASVDFTKYELDDDDHNPNNTGDDKQDIEGRETHQFSFSAGLLGKWQFSPKLSLKTGLVYSNIAIGIRPQTLYASAEDNQRNGYKLITSSGYAFVNPVFSASPATGDSISAEVAQHHLQYLSVPLMVGYKISAGKHLSITPGTGLSVSTLLGTKVRTEVNEDTDKETVVINKLQGLKKTYYSFTADAELNYTLNKHISITAFPVFKYALNSITKNNVVRTYPYSISLGAGISYRF